MDNKKNSFKSDIELILESQTWKSLSPKSGNLKGTFQKPQKLDPIKHILTPRAAVVTFSESPVAEEKKKILAIPFVFNSKLKKFISDEMANYVKIPSFPKLPFGQHEEMLSGDLRFELYPKEILVNTEKIRSIQLECGRIKSTRLKRTVTTSVSAPQLKIKSKTLGCNGIHK